MNNQAAKKVFVELATRGGEPRTVAEALGLIQVGDTGVIGQWVEDVLQAHPTEVTRFKNGEAKLLNFFLGQVMKASRGKADPKLAQRALEERLTA